MSERLTTKDLCQLNNQELYGKQIDWHSIYTKLCQFEDLMEENKFDSLDQLNEYISTLQDILDCSCYVDDLREENKKSEQKLQSYRNRWDKLERYITDRHNTDEKNAVAMTDILYKMRELEKEGKDEE